MKVEQIYTGCLAQGAYYLESNGEAAIIDPLREIKPYLQKAGKNQARIKYVMETHFHADFVSGHVDLAKAAGATIVFGAAAQPAFHTHIAQDGEVFTVCDVIIQVLHTPGHTLESVTYLLKVEAGFVTEVTSCNQLKVQLLLHQIAVSLQRNIPLKPTLLKLPWKLNSLFDIFLR